MVTNNSANYATGASGTVLTGNGVGVTPTFQASSGGASTGTWTPTLVGASTAGSTTYAQQNGYYTLIGSLVHIWGYVGISAATGTGAMLLGGFPYTIKSQTAYQPIGPVFWQGSASWTFPAGSTSLCLSGIAGSTTANVYVGGSAVAGGNVQMANASLYVIYSLVYQM